MNTHHANVAGQDRKDAHGHRNGFAWRSARRAGKARVIVLVVLGVMTAIVAAAWGGSSMSQRAARVADVDKHTVGVRSFILEIKEKGELKAAKSVDVKCEVEGRATIISIIEEGKAVKKGDLLVELASDQLDDRITQEELKEAQALTAYETAKTDLEIQEDRNASDVRKGELQVTIKELELKKYTDGDWGQQLKDAEVAITEAEILLKRREQTFKSADEMLRKDFITQTEYDEDSFNYQKAQWNLDKAKLAKQVLELYTHEADLATRSSAQEEADKELVRIKKNAQSEVRSRRSRLDGKLKELELTRTRLAKLRQQKEKCRILAPSPGFVVYGTGGGGYFYSSDGSGQIKEGASVHERQILMRIPDTTAMLATVRIHESKTDRIRVGQQAIIEIEGVPGEQFTGRVSKIASVADTQNRWLNPELKEYETEIAIDATDISLKPGATAHVRILVDEVKDVLAVPVQSIYAKGARCYAFREIGGEYQPAEVQVGPVGAEWVAIESGLSVDDRIMLRFDDTMTRMVPDLTTGQVFPDGFKAGLGMDAVPGHGGKPAHGKPKHGKQTHGKPAGQATRTTHGADRPQASRSHSPKAQTPSPRPRSQDSVAKTP